LIDAGSFLVSAGVLVALPARRASATAGRLLTKVVEGLRYTNSQPWLKVTLLANCIGLLFYVGPFFVLVPLLVRDEFDGGAGAYSILVAVGGAAAFTGAALAGHFRPRHPIVWAYAAWIVTFSTYALYPFAPSIPVLILMAGVSLGAGISADVIWKSLLQERVPDAMLGRVSSLDALATLGSTPLSIALAAPLAGLLGTTTVFVVGGAVATTVHALGALLVFSSRHSTPEPEPDEAIAGLTPAKITRAGR
jgi:MFS family permease